MSHDGHDMPGAGDPHHHHHHLDIGSVPEEAAKLLGALGDWAKDQGQTYADAASTSAEGVGEALREVDAHLATGAAECRYCPVCLVVSKVRATSPEVRQHLSAATTSLLAAVAGLLATPVPEDATRRGPVEKIDLGAEPEQPQQHDQPDPPASGAPWWSSDPADVSGPPAEESTDDLAGGARPRRSRRPCIDVEAPS